MFIRRLFYNSETGEVLHSYMMQGDIRPISTFQEAERLELEEWRCMEWNTPDPEVEENFEKSYGRVSVDIYDDEDVLVFDFSPLPEEESETDDMLNALQILGYEGE